jgi:hypothetical protein
VQLKGEKKMKALVTLLIMGLVFAAPTAFAKNKHAKANKAKAKQEKPVKNNKKIKEEAPAPQEDNMDAPVDQPVDDDSGE